MWKGAQKMADRILIIEMGPSLGEDVVLALAKAGFSVARVHGYPEALLSLEVFKPDMIILDHTSKDSLEMCRQLHTVFYLPVILLGKDPGSEIWRKALLEAEADCYVRKPFSAEVLVSRMKAILRRYRCQMPDVSDRTIIRHN